MSTEIIEKYITFGIDNGYDEISHIFKIKECRVGAGGNGIRYLGKYISYIGLIYGTKIRIPLNDIITSKSFISAIARGLNPTYKIGTPGLDSQIDWITNQQAIAIRDGKLLDFINKILKQGM